MNILFVSRFLPHPNVRDSGGQDVYNYIVSLSKSNNVSLISFAVPEQVDATATMISICDKVVTVPYYPYALSSRLWRLIWRWLMPKVYGRTFSLRYRVALKHLISENNFDVVIVDGMMASYGGLIQTTKILDEIDIYSIVAYHLYLNERHLLYRRYLHWDWMRTLAYELRYVNDYDSVLVRSSKDRLILNEYLPSKKIAVLSPWFEGLTELQSVKLKRPYGNKVLFVGAMNLPANIEAVIYFVQHIFPLIQQQIPEVVFYIVGSNPSPSVKQLNTKQGVVVVGEVECLTEYYEKCAVNVVPLLRGGGIIVKTLNGLAAARPTVSTPLGISGIEVNLERDLLVSAIDKPEMFADAVVNVLTDDVLWMNLAYNGRKFIQQTFDWGRITEDMMSVLKETIITTKGVLDTER